MMMLLVFSGCVYSLGRKEYGRLGLGKENLEEKSAPTLVPRLKDEKCVHVDCATAVSFAVTDKGTITIVVCYVYGPLESRRFSYINI